MLLPPAKKQKTPACIREIQVHKLLTKVYSQKGLTAMVCAMVTVVETEKWNREHKFYFKNRKKHDRCYWEGGGGGGEVNLGALQSLR